MSTSDFSPLSLTANTVEFQLIQRRQVSILFCDIVDYTSRSSRQDPEDLAQETLLFHSLCETIVKKHGGYVVDFLGDGILAVFGSPPVDEFACENSIRTGLAIIGAIRNTNQSPKWTGRIPFSV